MPVVDTDDLETKCYKCGGSQRKTSPEKRLTTTERNATSAGEKGFC